MNCAYDVSDLLILPVFSVSLNDLMFYIFQVYIVRNIKIYHNYIPFVDYISH